ncbi:MAG: hypothetical protein ABR968_12215, partial [Bacteroidales bacterium]
MKQIFPLRAGIMLALISLMLCSFNYNEERNKTHSTALISDTIHIINYGIHLNIVHLSDKTISCYTQLNLTPKMNYVNAIEIYLLE